MILMAQVENLQEVEILFDDLKHFVDIHPVRHWLEYRVRAHVCICILALDRLENYEVRGFEAEYVNALWL